VSEYALNIQSGTDMARLRSINRSRYVAGTSIENGFGVRFGALPLSTQEIKLGCFDESDGLYYKSNK